jgi:dTDP-4-dehydrorhamnose reductase
MRILVTGASGLLGLNLALSAAAAGHTVTGVVNRQTLQGVPFQSVEADLLAPGKLQQILEMTRPEWVIHCAALANLEACEADPELAQRLNAELPGQIAQLLAGPENTGHVARGGARLVHISTDCVFDGQRGGYSESDLPNPLGVYARTKLAGEQAVAAANPQAIIARVNLFGWSLTGKRSLGEFFFYNLQAGRPLKGFTDALFGPLLVNDLADVLLAMLAKNLSGLYHVLSPVHTSKYAFGVALAQRFGLDAGLITPVSLAEGGLLARRSPNLTLRTDKLQAALGGRLPTWETGLERFYELWREGYAEKVKGLAAPE